MYSPLPLLFFLQLGYAAKIGIFTAPISNSQIIFNIRMAEVLADGGHDVVIVRPSYNPKSTKIKSKHPKVREIRMEALPDPAYFQNFTDLEHKEIYDGLGFSGLMALSNSYKGFVLEACKNIVEDNEFIQKIRAENFDLAFHHHIDSCQLGIIHLVGIPKWVSTMPGPPHRNLLSEVGIPSLPSILPGILMNSTDQMPFSERAKSLFTAILFHFLGPYQVYHPETRIFRAKFGDDFPDLNELRKTAKLNFVNANQLVEYPTPVNNKVQFIGGIGTTQNKALVEPFLSFTQKASKIVLVSFGSVAVSSDMPQSWKNSFVEFFEQNPDISFIWKFEEDIKVPKNVLRSKWIPQNDILVHPKTVAFVTHGGYNSLGEAIGAAVPCIFVPLMADQYRNALLAQRRGFGLQLSKKDLSANYLNEYLHRIINEPKYKEAVVQLKSIVNSYPLKAHEKLLYWTNFVLQYDFDLSTPDLNFIQLYSLDVIFVFAFVVFAVLYILRTLGRWYYWSCFEMAYMDKVKND